MLVSAGHEHLLSSTNGEQATEFSLILNSNIPYVLNCCWEDPLKNRIKFPMKMVSDLLSCFSSRNVFFMIKVLAKECIDFLDNLFLVSGNQRWKGVTCCFPALSLHNIHNSFRFHTPLSATCYTLSPLWIEHGAEQAEAQDNFVTWQRRANSTVILVFFKGFCWLTRSRGLLLLLD